MTHCSHARGACEAKVRRPGAQDALPAGHEGDAGGLPAAASEW
ncbi:MULTISPECIES: hypothetical protein [Caballeronia]|nr:MULTISPECIES: hypothetical protein [Caballeronia]MDR5790154.1 hypothetical protein [Caballeronia sp. LP003]MDR5797514.1 hypothetical protein [Caballeronia sp. LZ008]